MTKDTFPLYIAIHIVMLSLFPSLPGIDSKLYVKLQIGDRFFLHEVISLQKIFRMQIF